MTFAIPGLPPPHLTAQEAKEAFGISQQSLDHICKVIGVPDDNPSRYFIAVTTFQEDLFELLDMADVEVRRPKRNHALTIEDMPWQTIHGDDLKNVMAMGLFEQYHTYRVAARERTQLGAAAPPRDEATAAKEESTKWMMLVSACTFARQLGFATPEEPRLNVAMDEAERLGRLERSVSKSQGTPG